MPATTLKSVRLSPVTLGKTILEGLKPNAPDRVFLNETLNTALRTKLATALSQTGQHELGGLIQKLDPADIAANNDVSIRAFVAKAVAPLVAKEPATKQAVDAEVAKLSSTTTVGALLGLDKPLTSHPLFQNEVRKVDLGSLLSTSPLVAAKQLQDEFISLYAAHQGSIEDFWAKLQQDPDFQAAGVVESLQLTLQLGWLTLNNVSLVAAIQNLPQGTVKSPRDLVKLDANAWTQLMNTQVNGQVIGVPDGVPGATRAEKVANYVDAITAMLKISFPTAALGLNLAQPPAIDVGLVRTVLVRNPKLNLATPLPANLDLSGLNAADQVKARASLETLRQEINTFPGFDYKSAVGVASGSPGPDGAVTRPAPSTFQNPIRDGISKFFTNSQDIELRTDHIDSYISTHPAALAGIAEKDRPEVVAQLRRFQRVLRVTPKTETVNTLLGEGLDSAYRISSIPQATFVQRFSDKLGSQAEAVKVYSQAQQVSAAALNLYTQVHRALNDVTPRVIGPVAEEVKEVLDQRFGTSAKTPPASGPGDGHRG